ncbi:DUF448 domain-containing protein [Sphingomonas sp. CROZ-RG-20F-R02-07]|uniref:DUF448 domain-containing protein n=1 Tax=Sphingomonas sp. CROZ-RG-20F-R02-07 TaxID=2914832 RepID=UPI001F5A8E70|nr:DUF448 domain-containing protein [Sphingomonas sp. CROZ-RG-20F-R02-07]
MRNPPDDTRTLNSPAARGRSSKARPAASAGGDDADGVGPIRRCILSGERAARDHLVRLALAPDGSIHPDVRAKAPGRGAWIGVTRAELEVALKKGKLKGGLARAFKTGEFVITPELPQQIATALERSAMDRLGLEARSGTLLTGSDKIETAARSGKLHALYHAADAGADGNRKLDQAWRIGNDVEGSDLRGLALPVPRTILGLALGRENVVHIGLTDRAAAKRVSEALARWMHFIGPEPFAAPCETASQGASASEMDGASGPSGDLTAVAIHEEFE